MREMCPVLHVDDDSDIRLIVDMALRLDNGMRVRSIATIEEALATLLGDTDYRPGVILLDQRIGGATGMELLGRIKSIARLAKTPVIFLTARAMAKDVEAMTAAGVRIHRFPDYLLHAKNVSFDGQLAIVGSSNVDIRSFQLNEEVSILLHDAATVARLESIQNDYIAASDLLDLAEWRARSRLRRFGENIARLVSPLL